MKNVPKTRELFVSEISFAAKEEDLRKLFELFGKVSSIHMVKEPKSDTFKGLAFVRMATPVQAKEVCNNLDGTYLIDRCIKITLAKPKDEKSASATKKKTGKSYSKPKGDRHKRKT